jgi:MFS transporter, DHA2 family, multidrug resistance protein
MSWGPVGGLNAQIPTHLVTTMTQNSKAARREWLSVAVLALPCLLVVMDLTVLFLAIPKLTADLRPSSTQLLWISDVYGFLIAGLLIAMGALGDRMGRRKVLLTGAVGFSVASLLSAFAVSPEMLIAARALQGIAGATLVPSAMALVFNLFPDEVERTKALGAVMASFAAGAALGPVVGGLLLSWFWWGSVFLLNVPLMLVLVVVGPRLLPEFRNPDAARIDVASVVLSTVAVMTAIYGVKQIAQNGVDPVPVLAIAAGAGLGAIFARRQLRISAPLIDLRLFRSRIFSTAIGLNVIGALVQYGIYLFTSQYMQLALGLSPLQAGLAGLPSVAALMAGSALVPKLAQRVRPGYAIASGLAVSAVGFAMLTQLAAHGLPLMIVASIVMVGGMTPGMILGTELIVGSVPPERAGVASGMAETSNELGGALGIALLGSLGTLVYRHDVAASVGDHVPSASADVAHDTFAGAVDVSSSLPASVVTAANDAFVHGVHIVAATNSLLMVAMAVVAAVFLRHVKSPGAQPEAEPVAAPARAPQLALDPA